MSPIIENITTLLAFGVVALDVFVVAGFLALYFFRDIQPIEKGLHFVSRHALVIGFTIVLSAVLGSLFYSNIAGYAPCNLCWWQRVFLYPQAVLFAVALYRKRKGSYSAYVFTDSLILSLIGGAIALFNYYGQSFNQSLLAACGATGVSCTKIYFNTFGFVTIPMMSLTVFAALIILVLIKRKY